MHTDTTQKEKPTGSANNPAGHTDSTSLPGAVFAIKAKLIGWASWLAIVFKGVA
ncbi:MAG: hypothetical protein RIR09_3191 [Pseudomonadota bacterium]|jgi:hypothetical protein